MAENDYSSTLGKKIFFFHPSALTCNEVIAELIQEEFEVYVITDQAKLRKAIKSYPGSIMFANINEVLHESEWEELVGEIVRQKETTGTIVGVIASIDDEALKQKYLKQYNVECGFTVVGSDLKTAVSQLTDMLNSVNAKGRRNYIRMVMDKETKIIVNIPMHGTFIDGVIKDLSVVGFSCSFAFDPGLTKNSVIGDIQFRLQGQLQKVEGIVFGTRMDGAEKIYVLLFSPRVGSDVSTMIRKYIQFNLQNRMDKELN